MFHINTVFVVSIPSMTLTLQDVAFPLGMIVVSNWVLGTPAPPGPQVASKI